MIDIFQLLVNLSINKSFMSHSFTVQDKHVKPGQTPIYQSMEGLFFTGLNMEPTWIDLPPELGGQRVNVLDVFMAKVCKCGLHPAKVLILEGQYLVVE